MDICKELKWLTEIVKQEGENTPKMLIYCTQVTQLNAVAEFFEDVCGDSLVNCNGNFILGTFHQFIGDFTKTAIIEEFVKVKSCIRIVVCTIAFGMGINIPDIRLVVHWGLSQNAMSYWQEVGRAGRDGLPAKAYLYVVPALFTSTVCSKFKDECKKLGGIGLDVARTTKTCKWTQYPEAQETTKEDVVVSSPKEICFRKIVLQHILLPGMSVAHLGGSCQGDSSCSLQF